MKYKTYIGFLIILVPAVFSAFAFVIWPAMSFNDRQGNSQPEQVVQDFYAWYLDYAGNPLEDRAYRNSKQLSPDFIQFLDDFIQSEMQNDLVLCAHDVPAGISTFPAQVAGDKATVSVSTSFANHSFFVELVQVNGDWLINKVICKP